ncbi:hypothetical protein [Saccharomonospora xinjiangensis]|uniref:Uncharacterized protein n=1 Tax=Saccharomonospora xinjiangensis XJ-54 TaxID=882086 RepID=I0V3E3_9PSEU|nr:hypothetical protein [Saccharomonospora xinjiangensis]EID54646.1 hypothetical protein SacxiDRAFT_2422 [Saccharomonospora xinjiangensis XJ-54]
MAVRLDVEPLLTKRPDTEPETENVTAPRRTRLNLNFVKLSTRKKSASLLFVDDPLALRYLCRA